MSDLDDMIFAVRRIEILILGLKQRQEERDRAVARMQELDNEIAEFQGELKKHARDARAAWKKNPLKDVIEDEEP